ncbi:hypothetical protein ACS0TY_035646 [Phlomoides rotata]
MEALSNVLALSILITMGRSSGLCPRTPGIKRREAINLHNPTQPPLNPIPGSAPAGYQCHRSSIPSSYRASFLPRRKAGISRRNVSHWSHAASAFHVHLVSCRASFHQKVYGVKYHELSRYALHEDQVDVGSTNADELRVLIRKYWVMTETSSPQFVIARSVTCTMSDVLSLFVAVVLVEAEVRMAKTFGLLRRQTDSSYGWSTEWVLLTQTIGVIVCSITPAFRWYNTVKSGSLHGIRKSFRNAVMVEDYWTQMMVDWSGSSLSIEIRHLGTKKVVHDLRGIFPKIFIYIHYLIVLVSKLILFISICITTPIIKFFDYFRSRVKGRKYISHHSESTLDLKKYVILLQGEEEVLTELQKLSRISAKRQIKLFGKTSHFDKKKKKKNSNSFCL